MSRWIVMALIVAGACAAATPASADELTLANGDVLRGELLLQTGDRIRFQHPVLGELDLVVTDVLHVRVADRDEPGATAAVDPGPPPEVMAVIAKPAGAAPSPAVAAVPAPSPATVPVANPCCPPEPEEKKPKRCWELSVGLNLGNETGNTEKFSVGTDLEGSYERGRDHFFGRFVGFYEEARDVQTEGNLSWRGVYARRISQRGRLFGMWVVDRDDFADLQLRNGVFGGYEHEFIKRKRTTLSGAVGAGYILEKRVNVPTIHVPAGFAQVKYKHTFGSKDSIEALYYVIPYFEYLDRSFMRWEVRYAHPLRDHLDLIVGFRADYVPNPPNRESWDTKATVGVRWKP